MTQIEILGYIATFLINTAYIPQVVKVIRTKQVKDLSLLMYITLIVAGSLFTVYSIAIDSMPLTICNTINVLQSCIILFYKIKYNK